jgi:hypothetical protein
MGEQHPFTHNGWSVRTWESSYSLGVWLWVATRGNEMDKGNVKAWNRVQAEREIRLLL